jgi:hypothetical protein
MVIKVISGGQSGADVGGLRAAKSLGIRTGGWMPKGFLTLEGPKPEYAQEFGLIEHGSVKYPPRTRANVRDADATLRFARNFTSPGERCTLKAIKDYKKPYLDVAIDNPPSAEEVREWLLGHSVKVLNVAGNSEKTAPGIEQFVTDFLVKVLSAGETPP